MNDKIKCSTCGNTFDSDEPFCPFCGAKAKEEPPEEEILPRSGNDFSDTFTQDPGLILTFDEPFIELEDYIPSSNRASSIDLGEMDLITAGDVSIDLGDDEPYSGFGSHDGFMEPGFQETTLNVDTGESDIEEDASVADSDIAEAVAQNWDAEAEPEPYADVVEEKAEPDQTAFDAREDFEPEVVEPEVDLDHDGDDEAEPERTAFDTREDFGLEEAEPEPYTEDVQDVVESEEPAFGVQEEAEPELEHDGDDEGEQDTDLDYEPAVSDHGENEGSEPVSAIDSEGPASIDSESVSDIEEAGGVVEGAAEEDAFVQDTDSLAYSDAPEYADEADDDLATVSDSEFAGEDAPETEDAFESEAALADAEALESEETFLLEPETIDTVSADEAPTEPSVISEEPATTDDKAEKSPALEPPAPAAALTKDESPKHASPENDSGREGQKTGRGKIVTIAVIVAIIAVIAIMFGVYWNGLHAKMPVEINPVFPDTSVEETSGVPIKVQGKDVDGNAVEELRLITFGGEAIELTRGDYMVTVLGNPVSKTGYVYTRPLTEYPISIDDDGVEVNGAFYLDSSKAALEIGFAVIAPDTVNDTQIAEITAWMQEFGFSAEEIDTYTNAIKDTRSAAVAEAAENEKKRREEEARALQQTAFKNFPATFTFSTKSGGSTTMTIKADGTFTGRWRKVSSSQTGSKYSKGTIRICKFSGKFSVVSKTGATGYALQLDELKATDKASKKISNNIRYIYVTNNAYGLGKMTKTAKKGWTLYLRGTKASVLSNSQKKQIDLKGNTLKSMVLTNGKYTWTGKSAK